MAGKQKRGPKTERGKAAVRLNPLKHGVLSQTPVIPLVERQEDWVRLRDGIFEYFDVEGMMEESLADLIAMLIWRRYRLVRFETEAISAYLESVPEDYRRMVAGETGEGAAQIPGQDRSPDRHDVEQMDRMLSARLMPGAETAEKIMRYETKLHRFLLQTIHQLLVLQALRRGSGGRPSPAIESGGDDRRITRGPRPRSVRRLEGFARALPQPLAPSPAAAGEGERVDAEVVVEGGDGAEEDQKDAEADAGGVLRPVHGGSRRGRKAGSGRSRGPGRAKRG